MPNVGRIDSDSVPPPVFDLARIVWNRLHAKPQPVRLGDLLADMEVQARPQCAAKGLRFRLRTSRALQGATLHTDRLMLQRIVSNLLANAIKYTERGGVLLALRGTPARPRLEVWDTGIGIPPAAQGRRMADRRARKPIFARSCIGPWPGLGSSCRHREAARPGTHVPRSDQISA